MKEGCHNCYWQRSKANCLQNESKRACLMWRNMKYKPKENKVIGMLYNKPDFAGESLKEIQEQAMEWINSNIMMKRMTDEEKQEILNDIKYYERIK